MTDERMTKVEVAETFGVSEGTVKNWVTEGRLTPAVGGGRGNVTTFDAAEVRRLTVGRPHNRPPVTLEQIEPLGPWAKRALCGRDDVDPAWFDAVTNDGNTSPREQLRKQYRAALICASCPVRAACLADAVQHRAIGVWGGWLIDGTGRRLDIVARLLSGWYTRAIPVAHSPRKSTDSTPATDEGTRAA